MLATVEKGTPTAHFASLWDIFQADYRWYVTGTPVPLGRASLAAALNFLGINLSQFNSELLREKQKSCMYPLEHLLFDAAKRCLFWRNTKESVKGQIEIPPLVEEIHFIEFSPLEKVMYDAAKASDSPLNELRKFCAIPTEEKGKQSRSSSKKNDNLEKRYLLYIRDTNEKINSHRNLYYYHLQEIVTLNTQIEDTEAEILRHANPHGAELRLKNEKRKMLRLVRERDVQKQCMINNLAALSVLSRMIENTGTTCLLCNKTIYFCDQTPCEHEFCAECINEHLETQNTCPTCSSPLRKQSLTSKLVSHSLSTYDKPNNDLITQFGGKLVAVGGYLQDVMRSTNKVKMIVFSQYEETLMCLTKILKRVDEESFRHQIVYCKGNITRRRKILDLFNSEEEGSPRILLLSLSHNASGTHLPIATHIILVDPVVGTEENAKALDSQAIARAHRIGQSQSVTAVRFIVRNSVEQDDYEGAYGKIQGGQLNKYSLVVKEFEKKKLQKDKKRKEFDEELANELEELEELNNPSPKKKRSVSPKKKTPAKALPKKRSTSPKKKVVKEESEEEEEKIVEKPKRGRPPKRTPSPKKKVEKSESEEELESEEEEKVTKPKRGRPSKRAPSPKKKKVKEESEEEEIESEEEEKIVEKPKRGRPPKRAASPKKKKVKEDSEEEEIESEEEQKPKRGRGRPPKRTAATRPGKSPAKKKQKVTEGTSSEEEGPRRSTRIVKKKR